MSDPETASIQAEHLRDEAKIRLEDAARCEDPARRDCLLRQALALLAQARILRGQTEREFQASGERDAGAGPLTTRLQ